MDKILELQNISFSYGKNNVITDFSLSVNQGEFITLLGPSGCGKTTILRLIAGFLMPDAGDILIGGKSVINLPVDKRKIGFVFQDYALFPHMTVRENLLFGFSAKDRRFHDYDLNEIADTLGLTEFLERYPHELSGGQQQRVALGRTLILKPEIILMDEPLSSLDATLRRHVRDELLEIQRKIGITTVYVTHDQEEALSLSSRIAVLDHGKLLQFNSPKEIYFHPVNRQTALFSGPASFIKTDEGTLMVRPEWFKIADRGDENTITATVISVYFLGNVTRCKLSCEKSENGVILVDFPCEAEFTPCEKVNLKVVNKTCNFDKMET